MAARKIRGVVAGLVLVVILLPAGGALADAIDGNWCARNGRHLSIDGPRITTPGGTRTTGEYDRHAFSYTVPAAEPGAGSVVSMILVDDDTIHLKIAAAPLEVWRRCDLTT